MNSTGIATAGGLGKALAEWISNGKDDEGNFQRYIRKLCCRIGSDYS